MGLMVGVIIYFVKSKQRNRLLNNQRKFLNMSQNFDRFDLYLSIAGGLSLVILFSSLIDTFLQTTTLSFPVFEIEEKIIIRYLITDGIYLFLPYLFTYYFLLTSIMIFGLARLMKIQCTLRIIFLTHLKTSWIFIIGLSFCFFTFLGLTFLIIVVITFILTKVFLDGIYLRKTLGISRKKTIFLKLMPILIYFLVFLLYLQIRFDILKLISLLL